MFGSAEQFNRAVKQLKRGGGTEDGYLAIDKAIAEYSVARLSAPHIILITDEHRTSVNHSVDINSLSSRLAEAQIPVTAIVNVRFLCDDKRVALGMNSLGFGIVLNTNGALDECNISELIYKYSLLYYRISRLNLAEPYGERLSVKSIPIFYAIE